MCGGGLLREEPRGYSSKKYISRVVKLYSKLLDLYLDRKISEKSYQKRVEEINVANKEFFKTKNPKSLDELVEKYTSFIERLIW